ncbi:MAG: C4-type zinc ribbon domain-containing protein [Chloroflexota bacterium]|jgi:predicted  nucleic acid-binding Zn-ribbon protein|nr:hypothetical protein [Anaerolineae bacterium]
MNPSQTLYRIQRVDLKLAAQRKRAREIDAELASDEAVQQAEQAQREIEQALRPQEARATNLNLELQTIAAQRSQFSAQLYGGAVSNPKELQDIEHKIEALARRHSELETALLETMIAVEDFQARLKEASAHLAEVQQARASENTALVEERQQIRAEIRQLKAQREKLVTEVSADALALYEDLWPRKQGHAVAVMDGDRCERCGVSQTEVMAQRVRQGQEIVFCSNCGRILITR